VAFTFDTSMFHAEEEQTAKRLFLTARAVESYRRAKIRTRLLTVGEDSGKEVMRLDTTANCQLEDPRRTKRHEHEHEYEYEYEYEHKPSARVPW
jgi:hypothetical protein